MIGVDWAFISFNEPGRGQPDGRGAYLDGNIMWNPPGFNGSNFANVPTNLSFELTVNRSLLPGTNEYPGFGSLYNIDPRLVNLTNITDPWTDFALQADSPARGTGPNGLDMGALVPEGASVSGEPSATTTQSFANLVISGPGIVAFKYKINEGAYSAEIPITNLVTGQSLSLSNLAAGTYRVAVLGKNSAAAFQPVPTLSRSWTVMGSDRDGDGMPDDWEEMHELDPDDPDDAILDADRDNVKNRDEYISGTDPQDPDSYLKVDSASKAGNVVTLRFNAVAGKTYTIQYKDSLRTGSWTRLIDVSNATGPTEVTDGTATGTERYYRIVTPALP
jgi:hypothetical protein